MRDLDEHQWQREEELVAHLKQLPADVRDAALQELRDQGREDHDVLSLAPLREKRSGCPAACGGGKCVSLAAGSMPAAKISLKGYNGGMVLRRTPHAVYDTLYHLVWSPKYRRDVLQGEIQRRVRELFADIAEQYDITIEEMEVSPDHVHIFCSFPPRYSIAQAVTRFKSLSARAIFREFPRVKRRLWGGELWEDGYFARTVGDKVTAEVIHRYIQQHRLEKTGDAQMSLFE